MAPLGKLFCSVRAGARRSPPAGSGFAAPESITVTSAAFADGGAMPSSSAGKGVGDCALTASSVRVDDDSPGESTMAARSMSGRRLVGY
jgi:hypothetical protein